MHKVLKFAKPFEDLYRGIIGHESGHCAHSSRRGGNPEVCVAGLRDAVVSSNIDNPFHQAENGWAGVVAEELLGVCSGKRPPARTQINESPEELCRAIVRGGFVGMSSADVTIINSHPSPLDTFLSCHKILTSDLPALRDTANRLAELFRDRVDRAIDRNDPAEDALEVRDFIRDYKLRFKAKRTAERHAAKEALLHPRPSNATAARGATRLGKIGRGCRDFLIGKNPLVLFQRDASFFAEFDLRPLSADDDGRRQPVHVQGEVVQATQEDVGRYRTGVEEGQEMFRPGVDQFQAPDGVKGLLAHRAFTEAFS